MLAFVSPVFAGESGNLFSLLISYFDAGEFLRHPP
jgi:hypothetical protein